MTVKLSDLQVDGYIRIDQSPNRDIEFNLYPNIFVVDNAYQNFFDFMVKTFNQEINPTGYKVVIEDENGNVVIETDSKLFDTYETENYKIAELDLSYSDTGDPTEDRNVYIVKLMWKDDDGNKGLILTSKAPQNTTFAENIGDGKKAVVIHASDGKATVNVNIKLFIPKY